MRPWIPGRLVVTKQEFPIVVVGIFDLVNLGQLILQDSLEALLAHPPCKLLLLGQAEYFIGSLGAGADGISWVISLL